MIQMKEYKENREHQIVLDWFLDRNNENKPFDMGKNSEFVKTNNIDEKGRGKITRFFGKMRDSFIKEQDKLMLEGNETEKFEKTKEALRNCEPPLFYVMWTGKEWIVPTYEQKLNNNSKLGNRHIKIASKHLEEMTRDTEYILTSTEFQSKGYIELVNEKKIFQQIISLYQKMVESYDTRMECIYTSLENQKCLIENKNETNRQNKDETGEDKIKDIENSSIWSKKRKVVNNVNRHDSVELNELVI